MYKCVADIPRYPLAMTIAPRSQRRERSDPTDKVRADLVVHWQTAPGRARHPPRATSCNEVRHTQLGSAATMNIR